MSIAGINHINIRTTDIEKSAQFYVDVFAFRFKAGDEIMGNRINWLYDSQDQPIIHLRKMEADSSSTGPIDHIAFTCHDKEQIIARLQTHNIEYAISENLMPGITQIFLKDPHGIALELNFSSQK